MNPHIRIAHALWLAVFALWTLGEIFLLLRTRSSRTANNWDRGTLRLLWMTIVLSISAGQFLCARLGPAAAFASPHARADLHVAALALLLLGVALRFAAIQTLGRAFSVNVAIRSGQSIVQHGLYAHVRHPSYTALLVIFFALGLQTANPLALAVTLLPPAAALLWRIHVEERALRSGLGAAYDDYALRVPHRLIPGLW